MLQELFKAFFLIFIAEMGDKTQILAMAFATQYPVKKVLTGIFLGVLLNHGLAVALGSFLSSMVPLNTIQVIAGFAFVLFALWTLKPVNEGDNDASDANAYSPVFTVAAAFFIGELGDKTQLTAITLAVDAAYPVIILTGTVLGMMITGGMGIFIGKKLGDKTPDFVIKLVAAGVFLIFGVAKLTQALHPSTLTPLNISIFIIAVGAPMGWFIRIMLDRRRRGVETAFQRRARELHDYYLQINESVSQMCLDNGICQTCRGNECLIGYTKTLIKQGMAEAPGNSEPKKLTSDHMHKIFDSEKTLRTLKLTLEMMQRSPENLANPHLHRIRRNLETILFNFYLQDMPDWTAYDHWLMSLDQPDAHELAKVLRQELSPQNGDQPPPDQQPQSISSGTRK